MTTQNLRRLLLVGLIAGTSAAGLLAQQGIPAMPVGPLKLSGLALREAKFDPPYRVIRDDGTVDLRKWGYQVVVRGESFPTRALDPILWLDDVPLIRYERCQTGTEELVYTFFDIALLRSEHVAQVIYGTDERTRTRLLERLDPEKLERLPEADRKALQIPDPEFVTLDRVGADGSVQGHGRLAAGPSIRLAARLGDATIVPLAATVTLAGDGRFTVAAGSLPKGTTHLVALLVAGELAAGPLDGNKLPKGVELLDSKPVGK